jgi:hypothetical protein
MPNTPSPVIAIARIACTKRLAPLPILWYAILVSSQALDPIDRLTFSSENLQEIIDALRLWHNENGVDISIDMVPGVARPGYFDPIVEYLVERVVPIPDLYSDADFILARLSMNHD